ncbi:DotH/IcmK family type IV secretion protein [Legionella gresilensis]|uniref:DotH/IcmK family type IV secretion protein n=1 Tax=Legionella gresilensis TaxID=91823 RepID=UPI003D070417
MTILSSVLYASDQSDSAQQALQQLRLLQQRLSQNQGSSTNTTQTKTTTTASDTKTQSTSVIPNIANSPTRAVTTTTTRNVPAVSTVPSTSTTTTTTAEAAVNPVPVINKESLDEVAFESVAQQLFPLTPEQTIRLKQMFQTAEFAQASPAGVPPKPTATSQFVNLSPGSTPPVIRLAQGFVSSLVFLDSTGAPWPISAYDLGDPSSFNIQWDRTSNTLMIQATKLYTYGNLAVRLRGLNTPVMLTLIPGQKAVDYRVDLRVQGYGPHAITPVAEVGLPPSANDLLLHVLDGVPPGGSQRLTVSGGDARAWLFNNRMYVRTNLTILSPGWISSMTSADGMHAYEMQKSPVLLVSWHGKVMQLKVEGL